MIEINELRVTRNGRTICSVPELRVAAGERLAVMGSNGSGKSTLLRVLAGLELSYIGRCTVGTASRERVFVHQSPYLFRGTVLSNVMYGLRARGRGQAECSRESIESLKRLGIGDMSGSDASRLSGGERRRVALARAIVLRPSLLLLDEPLADLDDDGTAAVAAALDDLSETTILIASPTPLPDGLCAREYRMSAAKGIP